MGGIPNALDSSALSEMLKELIYNNLIRAQLRRIECEWEGFQHAAL
jgi:hypothetical protein